MLPLCIVAASVISQAALPPAPSLAERVVANKTVREVFGDAISAAKTPEAKAAVVADMLRAAEGESAAAKFELLDQARDLAVSADELGLAVDVTRKIVAAFVPPGDAPASEWIAKGNEAWKGAKSVGAKLAAAEWYLRAELTAKGLDKTLIERRIGELVGTVPDANSLFVDTLNFDRTQVYPGWDVHRAMSLAGAKIAHPISTHPDASGSGRVAFTAPPNFRSLSGRVAIADSADRDLASTVTFRIVANKKTIWKSEPMQKIRESCAFSVAIPKGAKIELVVDCPGDAQRCHVVWASTALSEHGKK